MTARRVWLPALLILLLPSPARLPAQTPEEITLPALERGLANFVEGGTRRQISFSRSYTGPLFALPPIAGFLGGSLEIGPLGQGHTLTVEGTSFVFGYDSRSLTIDQEIVALSQPPAPGPDGIQVPLDLLRRSFGNVLGYEFTWQEASRTLTVERRSAREVSVDIDLFHLKGVTTVVLQFSEPPRYRITRGDSSVQVELIADQLDLKPFRAPRDDALIERIQIGSRQVRIVLADNAEAEDYVLEDPFRIVFDLFRTSAAPPPLPDADGALTAPRRRNGLRTIVIDPGHGGAETGAIGPSGTAEKDLTLLLARTLRNRLQQRLPARVILTRDEDAELPTTTRAALANQQKADLFISLHLNSAFAAQARGAETYFLSMTASDEAAAQAAAVENQARQEPGEAPIYDLQLILWDLAQSYHMGESQRLATLIQEELNLTLDLRDRGVKQAPFRVLMGAAMPAVLVEMGFISNPQEEAKLRDPAYREQLVEALVRAVLRFTATGDGEAPPTAEATP